MMLLLPCLLQQTCHPLLDYLKASLLVCYHFVLQAGQAAVAKMTVCDRV